MEDKKEIISQFSKDIKDVCVDRMDLLKALSKGNDQSLFTARYTELERMVSLPDIFIDEENM